MFAESSIKLGPVSVTGAVVKRPGNRLFRGTKTSFCKAGFDAATEAVIMVKLVSRAEAMAIGYAVSATHQQDVVTARTQVTDTLDLVCCKTSRLSAFGRLKRRRTWNEIKHM